VIWSVVGQPHVSTLRGLELPLDCIDLAKGGLAEAKGLRE
jgi:hypothetical protein